MKTIVSLIILYLLGPSDFRRRQGRQNAERNQIQQIYTAELGVREKTGKNDGVRVEKYLRHVGLKKGDPWCAAFVCWVLDEAGVANPRTGWSPGLFPRSKVVWERDRKVAGGRVAGKEVAVAGKEVAVAGEKVAVAGGRKVGAERSLPQKGDVFGIWFPDKGRIAHVGFVDSWSDKWLITVEGNTNEAGSREGDGVLRKRRLVRTVYQVSQFID